MEYLTIAGLVGLGLIVFLAGALCMLLYIVLRMMKNDGWDDSNILNALRLLSHVAIHNEDFAKMFYLTEEQFNLLVNNGHDLSKQRPFWYISEDEFETVVDTRPK